MDPVERKLSNAEQALQRFREILAQPANDVVRDSAILRFTLSVETAWKAARAFIVHASGPEKLTSASPKPIVRESQIAGLLTEAQAVEALAMMDDRNLTVHTYDEEKANALYSRLPAHADLIDIWLKAMRAGLAGR